MGQLVTTERPPTDGRHEKWVLRVDCPHHGAETCECRREALAQLLAQWAQGDGRPLVILPPEPTPDRDPDALGALWAWAGVGLAALLMLVIFGRQLWLVIT